MSASSLFALILGAVLAAEPADPLDGVLNGPAEPAAIFQARAALSGCAQPICQAVDHIAQAFTVATRRDLPNTMVQLDRVHGDPYRDAERALHRLVPAGGAQTSYCRVLTKLARHYTDRSVGLLVIEFSNRVDGAGDRCTRDVIAAFPQTSDAADTIAASRDVCQAARRAGCARDRRPRAGV